MRGAAPSHARLRGDDRSVLARSRPCTPCKKRGQTVPATGVMDDGTGKCEKIDFSIYVDAERSNQSPRIHGVYFLSGMRGEMRNFPDDMRVLVHGELRHRRDAGGIFVSVRDIMVLARET